MSETHVFKNEYETAVHKFNKSTYLALYLTCGFMLLSLFGYMLISINRSSILFVAKSDLAKPGTEHQILLLLGFGVFFLISCVLPLTCLFYYDNRLRRNPTLHCPLCDTFLGMEHISTHVLKTGMCPECKEMLFEGEVATKAESLQYYHQLNVDANQRTKSEMKSIPRFTFLVSILASVPSLLIYVWMKRINESMGEPAPSIYQFYVFYLIFPPMLWFVSRLSLKECERCDEELRKEAYDMNIHSLKGDSNN